MGFALWPQSAGSLAGAVRDEQGHGIAGSPVTLRSKQPGQAYTTHTDGAGSYHFAEVAAGAYTIRSEAGSREISVAAGEAKRIDFTTDYSFADEPHFIVAGVTDPTARGGHGSDTVLRSSEALAKATAALDTRAAENRGEALAKVREYQGAAERDASEPNLFRWGSELLLHGAGEAAREVFGKGHRLYPQSTRMLLGLAAARYARGEYEDAAAQFFAACDLHPEQPAPYLFLGQIQSTEIIKMPGYAERLDRFARLEPENALANFYLGTALWERREGPEDVEAAARARELLEKAIQLDSTLAAAYLQLGIVYSDAQEGTKAIAAYQKAIESDPNADEPHYRLGREYARIGEREKSRKELGIYQEMSGRLQQQRERERKAMQQFVIELR